MTDVERLEKLIFDIFSLEKKIKVRSNTNKCISALNSGTANSNTNYSETESFKTKSGIYSGALNLFALNFIKRLERLSKKFKSDIHTINEIAEKIKNIGEAKNSGWAGPYSELVALDFYSQFSEFFNLSYINILPVSEHKKSLPALIGHKETIDIDLCLHFRHYDIFTDVKSFNCIHQNILEEVFDSVEEYALLSLKKSVMIGADNLSSLDYSDVKKNLGYEKRKIYSSLVSAVAGGKRVVKYESKSGISFTFRIQYTNTIETVTEYSPFAMAEAYKFKFLDYGSKLLDNEYSIITMVKNPWFNNETVDFGDFNNMFYRSLARRTFIELNRIDDNASEHSSAYAGTNLKVSDVAKNLAGIIFIDDKSAEEKTAKNLYNAYFYLNPNYKNRIPLSIRKIEKYFRNRREIQIQDFDDFKWDNY